MAQRDYCVRAFPRAQKRLQALKAPYVPGKHASRTAGGFPEQAVRRPFSP